MQKLKLGPNNAEFVGTLTASMAGGNALTLTQLHRWSVIWINR
jgi:hypothetical protein